MEEIDSGFEVYDCGHYDVLLYWFLVVDGFQSFSVGWRRVELDHLTLCGDGSSESDVILVLGHFEQNGLCSCSVGKGHHGRRLPIPHLIGLDLDPFRLRVIAQLLEPFTGVHSIHPRVYRMRDLLQLSLRKVIQPPEVIRIPQLRDTDSLRLIYLQTAEDDFLEIAGDRRPHLAAIEGQREVIPEVVLQFAEGVRSVAMQ